MDNLRAKQQTEEKGIIKPSRPKSAPPRSTSQHTSFNKHEKHWNDEMEEGEEVKTETRNQRAPYPGYVIKDNDTFRSSSSSRGMPNRPWNNSRQQGNQSNQRRYTEIPKVTVTFDPSQPYRQYFHKRKYMEGDSTGDNFNYRVNNYRASKFQRPYFPDNRYGNNDEFNPRYAMYK